MEKINIALNFLETFTKNFIFCRKEDAYKKITLNFIRFS